MQIDVTVELYNKSISRTVTVNVSSEDIRDIAQKKAMEEYGPVSCSAGNISFVSVS